MIFFYVEGEMSVLHDIFWNVLILCIIKWIKNQLIKTSFSLLAKKILLISSNGKCP